MHYSIEVVGVRLNIGSIMNKGSHGGVQLAMCKNIGLCVAKYTFIERPTYLWKVAA